jgi:hypothetical protein
VPYSKIEPTADGERDGALTGAVACLDELDARIAERCSATVLQDIVGNLLQILSRLEEADRAGGDMAMRAVADCRALAIESLTLAGVPEHRIEEAVSAVALVEAIVAHRNAKPD